MGYGVKFIVSGNYALFTRPEMKVERVSYDVPTPSSMIGLLSSIYWHPGIVYVIDKIYVYNDINFININRNEVNEKLSITSIKSQMKGTKQDISIYRNEKIAQRNSLLLKDVSYGVEAHFILNGEQDNEMDEKKCYNILLRRLKKGQHFSQPFLGCREFSAKVNYVEGDLSTSELKGDIDLGFMLYDLQYHKDKNGNSIDKADPRFYRPRMVDGVIDVNMYAKEGGFVC